MASEEETFGTIVADPPWSYGNPGEFKDGDTAVARGGGSHERYGSMTMPELFALGGDVKRLAAEQAHLYLWTTNLFVPEAFELAVEWGFRPITLCTWVKTTEEPVVCKGCRDFAKTAEADLADFSLSLPVGVVRASPRTGYYYKGATEHCLFAVRGKATNKLREALPTAWLWPRKPHSVKPPAFYDMVERVSPGPRLEMFARSNRLGWSGWGDQSLEHVVMGEGDQDVIQLKEARHGR